MQRIQSGAVKFVCVGVGVDECGLARICYSAHRVAQMCVQLMEWTEVDAF